MSQRPSRAGSAPLDLGGLQACAGVDTAVFFTQGGPGRNTLAKSICARCPVSTACLDYALTATGVSGVPVDGIWGGTTRPQRAAIRKQRGLRLDRGVAA